MNCRGKAPEIFDNPPGALCDCLARPCLQHPCREMWWLPFNLSHYHLVSHFFNLCIDPFSVCIWQTTSCQMWINPRLKIVPNKYTPISIRIVKTTVALSFGKLLSLFLKLYYMSESFIKIKTGMNRLEVEWHRQGRKVRKVFSDEHCISACFYFLRKCGTLGII